jgi:VanZ family protein
MVLLLAAVVPWTGQGIGAGLHWGAHLASFAMLAFLWRCGLARVPVLAIGLGVVAFGFAHEAIEIIGHAHDYELADAAVDAIGAIIGVLLAHLPARRLAEN